VDRNYRSRLDDNKDDRERTGPSPRRPPTPHRVVATPTSPGCRQEAPEAVNEDINVLALVKGRERYIFLYEDSQRAEALRTLGRFASNPELSFTWYDAAVLSQKVRNSTPATTPVLGASLPRRLNLPQASDE
jgi:hypothetical protein